MADTMPVARRRIGLNAIVVVGDTHKYALKTGSYTPGQEDYNASDGFEASGTGYTSGGNTVTGLTNANGSAKAFSDFADPAFPGLTASFRYGVLYRTSDNKVVLEQDLGAQSVTATDVTITQPAAAEGTAVIRL